MIRSYVLFLVLWVAFSWALNPAGGFGYIAAFLLAAASGAGYARHLEQQKAKAQQLRELKEQLRDGRA